MKSTLKRWVRGPARKLLKWSGGADKHRDAIDLTAWPHDPRMLGLYGKPVIVHMPVAAARSKVLPLMYDGRHPFVAAVKAGCRDGKTVNRAAVRNVLKAFYERVQPQNPAEWLGLESWEAPADVSLAVLSVFICPWRVDGWSWHNREGETFHFGPVSTETLDIEADRLVAVAESVRREGLRYDKSLDGCVVVDVLINEKDDMRWRVRRGNHRMAVFAALGHTEIPVRVNGIVYRNMVDYWPMVRDGRFTREQALQAFDTMFEAKPLPLLVPWCSWLEQNR